jgi:hypothetical protein
LQSCNTFFKEVDVINIRGFVIGFYSSRSAPYNLDILSIFSKTDEYCCIIDVVVHHLKMLEVCLYVYEVAMQEVIHHIGERVILKALCGPGKIG